MDYDLHGQAKMYVEDFLFLPITVVPRTISRYQVSLVFVKLRLRKASGADGILINALRLLPETKVLSLVEIFNAL